MTDMDETADPRANQQLPDDWRWVRLGDVCIQELYGRHTAIELLQQTNVNWQKGHSEVIVNHYKTRKPQKWPTSILPRR